VEPILRRKSCSSMWKSVWPRRGTARFKISAPSADVSLMRTKCRDKNLTSRTLSVRVQEAPSDSGTGQHDHKTAMLATAASAVSGEHCGEPYTTTFSCRGNANIARMLPRDYRPCPLGNGTFRSSQQVNDPPMSPRNGPRKGGLAVNVFRVDIDPPIQELFHD